MFSDRQNMNVDVLLCELSHGASGNSSWNISATYYMKTWPSSSFKW